MKDVMLALEQEKISVESEIKVIVDLYWQWMDTENRRVMDEFKKGEGAGNVLSRAPVVEFKSTGGFEKLYVTWRDFHGYRVKGKNYSNDISKSAKRAMSFGKRLKATKSEVTKATLLRHIPDWSVVKLSETEASLIPLRDKITAIHDFSVTYINLPKKSETKAKKFNVGE